MEQHAAPAPCNSLVVFLGQPACRASQTRQARLTIRGLAEKVNSFITFKPFLLAYRRHRSGRWLLSLSLLRTEIVAAVRGGPSLLPSPPSEEAGCGAARLRHPGEGDPRGPAGQVAPQLPAVPGHGSEPRLPASRIRACSHPLRCRFAFPARGPCGCGRLRCRPGLRGGGRQRRGRPRPRTAALGSWGLAAGSELPAGPGRTAAPPALPSRPGRCPGLRRAAGAGRSHRDRARAGRSGRGRGPGSAPRQPRPGREGSARRGGYRRPGPARGRLRPPSDRGGSGRS